MFAAPEQAPKKMNEPLPSPQPPAADASREAHQDHSLELANTRKAAARQSVMLFGAVLGGAGAMMLMATLLDLGAHGERWAKLLNPAGLEQALDSLAEVMAAILGLTLTVVAIVVQLASQRYPAKIVDLFMTDRRNVSFFGFMASSCIYVTFAPAFAANQPNQLTAMMIGGLLLVAINFALLLPYFAYVFRFLEPTNIIDQFQRHADAALTHAITDKPETELLARSQRHLINAIDRIADNSMAAVNQHDRSLATHTVLAIEEVLRDYLAIKHALPPGWGQVHAPALNTLAREFLDEIIANNTWVEAKILMELERTFRTALATQMNEIISQVATSTRAIGLAALTHKQDDALELTIQFFNTYIRHTLNQRNVRAAYNVLYEYRRFASKTLEHKPATCARIIEHLVYYGRTANAMNLPFVTVTVAHDVRVLCEDAYQLKTLAEVELERMLELFLSLDQPSDDEGAEVALLGVRRAQSILGAFFLEHGAKSFAAQIRKDMSHEPQSRLIATREAILAIRERKFWEITDRGFNFDYVPESRRPFVMAFFAPMLRSP